MKHLLRLDSSRGAKTTKYSINRYDFSRLFREDRNSGLFYPICDVIINNIPYKANELIQRGFSTFGGITFYKYVNRDIAGTWNNEDKILTILGFY